MKEKIIEIVGFNMEPERAELIAQRVLDLFAVSGSLPSEEDIFQWAVKKSKSFERNLLARQCFIEGAEYMRKCVERGNVL